MFSSDRFYQPENFKDAEILQLDESFETPIAWDWRNSGAVSSIKDQLPCGSW